MCVKAYKILAILQISENSRPVIYLPKIGRIEGYIMRLALNSYGRGVYRGNEGRSAV